MVKFPNVVVSLTEEDGNAFAILARVSKAMRKNGVDPEDIADYRKNAVFGDYNHLLQVTMQTVNVE